MKTRDISFRENYLRALEYRYPAWIPVHFDLSPSSWLKYGAALEEIVLQHPFIFPEYRAGDFRHYELDPFFRGDAYTRDDWGCVWYCREAGLLGRVIEHPLADWQALRHFRPPDPLEQFNWSTIRSEIEQNRKAGRLTRGVMSITQGGFFDRLQFLRGLENLLVDFMEDPPQLSLLIQMLLEYNLKYIRQWLEIGVDQFYFHGDIGTQRALLFSPDTFRKYLKPPYQEMFSLCRRAGSHVWYSSDGHVLEIVDDLIECGVTLHDPQVGPNALEDIARVYKGRLCAEVDVNEQVFPASSPADLCERVRHIVETMDDPRGGLMLYIGCSHDTPLANISALCNAVEKYCL